MKKYGILVVMYCFLAHLHSQSTPMNVGRLDSIVQNENISVDQPTDSIIKQLAFRLASINDHENYHKADLHYALGYHYFLKKDYERAYQNIVNARNFYRLENANFQDATFALLQGKILFHRGNYLLAAQFFNEALRALRTKPHERLEDEARDGLLQVYNHAPSINLTTSFFLQSFEIKQKLGDTKGQLRVAQKLSDLYFQNHQYKEALIYYDEVIRLAKLLKLDNDVIWAQTDKATVLTRLKKFDAVVVLLDPLQAYTQNKTDQHTIAKIYTAWADYYLLQGDSSKAELYYQQALPDRPSPPLVQYVFKHKADAYRYIGKHDKAYAAQEQYVKNLTTSHISDMMPGVIDVEERSARLKMKDEIKYLNKENQLKDALFLKEKSLAEILESKNEIQNQQLIAQQALANAMEREVQLQNQKLKDERKLRLLFLGSSIAFLVMGLTIFYLYKKQKAKNEIISKKSSENEVLMKEIHHRVKNNLQIISSLLDLQALSMEDSAAADAIKEGKNRVQSMALIHQNLYKDGHIRSLQIDEYIRHLVATLIQSYTSDTKKIHITYDMAPLQLDVDTVVPLGIIINELVTNTLKYAFPYTTDAKLRIELYKQNEQVLYFKLSDNGVGFPPDWSPEQNKSFGYQLIKAFSKKLKAHLKTFTDQGAHTELIIHKFNQII